MAIRRGPNGSLAVAEPQFRVLHESHHIPTLARGVREHVLALCRHRRIIDGGLDAVPPEAFFNDRQEVFDNDFGVLLDAHRLGRSVARIDRADSDDRAGRGEHHGRQHNGRQIRHDFTSDSPGPRRALGRVLEPYPSDAFCESSIGLDSVRLD